MIMLEMKFKSNENQVIKEIAKHGNADMSMIQEILDKQWRNSVKVNLLTLMRQVAVMKNIKMSQRKWHQ